MLTVLLFSYRCLENCGTYIKYNVFHNLAAACGVHTQCRGHITWQWTLFKCTSEKATDCSEVPSEIFGKMISTRESILYYSVKPLSYDVNHWYKLRFRGYRTEAVYGETSLLFYVNHPPQNGKDMS